MMSSQESKPQSHIETLNKRKEKIKKSKFALSNVGSGNSLESLTDKEREEVKKQATILREKAYKDFVDTYIKQGMSEKEIENLIEACSIERNINQAYVVDPRITTLHGTLKGIEIHIVKTKNFSCYDNIKPIYQGTVNNLIPSKNDIQYLFTVLEPIVAFKSIPLEAFETDACDKLYPKFRKRRDEILNKIGKREEIIKQREIEAEQKKAHELIKDLFE